MADMETPEADALEQQEPLVRDEAEPELGTETPEADALEQSQAVSPVLQRTLHPIADGVPEADALEQSYDVEIDEEGYER